MKQVHYILILLVILSACTRSVPQSTASWTAEEPTTTASVTPKPSRTPRPTATFTSTPWIKTYPTKKALVIYGEAARTFYSSRFINIGPFDFNPQLVLYADGQLILNAGRYEKQLSQKETEEVLRKLEQLGFFKLQDAFAANWQNLFSTPPPETLQDLTLTSIELTVNNGLEDKTIKYMKEDEEYLVRPMKRIIAYLDNFSKKGARPYQPDRLLVSIVGEKEIPLGKDITAIPWPDDIPPPSYLPDNDLIYLEGTEASKFYKMIIQSDDYVFSFAGQKFQALVRPLYPHECHVYHYFEVKLPRLSDPPFRCDDW